MIRTPLPITAYALASSLGPRTDDALRALKGSRRGLRAPPVDVPFETVTGTVPFALPELPDELKMHDSRTARLAFFGIEPMRAPVEAAVRRYGAERVALVLGTSTGGIDRTEDAHHRWWEAGQGAAPLPADYRYHEQHTFHSVVDLLGAHLGLRGPAYVVSTACSSSAKVFASARRLIELDVVDAALVGGVDALCHTTVRGFHGLGVMASEPCRPFGANRPGMNVGEAAAYLLLERRGEARAFFRGAGESSDAYHMSSPQPEGLGAQAAMRVALAEAGIDASEVDHVNAHGTGTRHNDSAEATALRALFAKEVPVVSTKAFTGHTLGACGGTEAILSLLCLEHGLVPAALGSNPADEGIDLTLPESVREQRLRYVISNAFAFGGNNCSLLFEAA
ncbi:MAG: beta-ketoacyl-ACP synthase [Myxococcota bacterium]